MPVGFLATCRPGYWPRACQRGLLGLAPERWLLGRLPSCAPLRTRARHLGRRCGLRAVAGPLDPTWPVSERTSERSPLDSCPYALQLQRRCFSAAAAGGLLRLPLPRTHASLYAARCLALHAPELRLRSFLPAQEQRETPREIQERELKSITRNKNSK